MHQEPPTPFDTIGDEPVEARIVAWVLGESSAFEAAELERLCEERPELLVFRRRMRTLHGLLTEAEAAEPDHSWKLPPEKRKLLDEIFGEETVVRLDARKELRIRRYGRRAMLAIAACVAITFFITRLTPWKHEAEAIIEVRPRSMGISPLGGGSAGASSSNPFTPQFFGTEFEKIKSRNSLEKVVENLELPQRWNIDKESALKRVKDSIETRNVPGTDLLSIKVRDASERDAREITHEVVRAYKQYRSGIEQKEADKSLFELKKAVRDQEDKVEERRKVLATIVRTKGIIHNDSYHGQFGVDEDQGARNSLKTHDQLLRDKMQTEGQINSLLKYDSDQLMTYASGLDLPDNSLKGLHPQYLEAKRQLEALKIKGEGAQHSEVVAAENQLKAMKHQMDEGVIDLRETLKAKLDTANDSLKIVETMKNDTREESIKRGLDAQDYADAKREFETDQQLLQSMKLKQIDETIAKKMSEDSIVVHEMPPPVESEKVVAFHSAPAASGWKSEIAFKLDSAAKESDESLARNGTASLSSDAEIQKSKATPGQQPAPAAAPAAPGEGKSFAMSSNRQSGRKENARQLQPARQPTVPQSRVFAEAAPSTPALDTPSEIEVLPAIAAARGLGGDADAFRDARARVVPPSTETATAAAEPEEAQLLAKDSAPAKKWKESRSEFRPASYGLSLGDRFDTDAAVAGTSVDGIPADPNQLGLNGVTSGLRSGDQAINRNSIDAILNNPDRVASGAGRNEEIRDESDAMPPVLADKKSGDSNRKTRQVEGAAAIDGVADTSGFNKSGAGGLTLNGVNSYSGATSITGGVLKTEAESRKDQTDDIDVVLNNPDQFSAGASAGKGIKVELDAMPPALADRESTFTAVPGQATIVSGVRVPLGGTVGNLAEGGEKSGAGGPLGNDSSTIAGEEGRLTQENWGGVTVEPAQAVDQVRRNLYTAEGSYNLGKYDDAKKSYQETLKVDPYNSAARRGLEKVEAAKSDYYRAAYDHTRAELLAQVDAAWELKVPADEKAREFEGVVNYGSPIQDEQSADQGGSADPFTEADESSGKLLAHREATPAKPAEQNLVDLMEEIPAAENPYSTFSLNISDASFQLAKAALAKGERPDPERIKPEQFYNAVDYGDPAPSSNEPVAATIEQSAHPIIPGRNLVRVALRTGSAGRSAAQPLRLTLLVDQSGSMVREDRRASMEHALAQLGVLLTKADLVTVIGFSRTPHLLADGMTGDQAAKLGDLVNQTASEGGTNLEEAMKLGAEKALRHQLAGAQNRIVLFTDGAANLGDANPDRLAAQVKALRQKGIAFDIAGIGADGLNDRLLSELARNGNGRYYVVGSENNDSFARQLAGAFRPAAENVKVQVNFNPQRVGKYKLIGFEKDRLKTEDFRNDAVDAAELAAEEAGVAIYQVEPLADGTGELGEVSVRFRDAASGQMVERAWTIPYAAQATAFDRATPSMQLAGLSLLAAEKLQGGPLADAIDFNQLTGPSAFVKQFYGSSPRVGDMLRVIDALK